MSTTASPILLTLSSLDQEEKHNFSINDTYTTPNLSITAAIQKNPSFNNLNSSLIGKVLNSPIEKLIQKKYSAYNLRMNGNIGLFTSVCKWMALHLLLLIIIVPLLMLMLFYMLIFMRHLNKNKLCQQSAPLYIFSSLFISISFVSIYIITQHGYLNDAINLSNTLTPIIQCVLFSDAIVATMDTREYLYTIRHKFKDVPSCNFFGIPMLIKMFLPNYSIWGASLKQYKPYGTILNESEQISFSKCFHSQLPLRNDLTKDKNPYHLKVLYIYHGKSQRIFSFVSILTAIIYLAIPTIYFFVDFIWKFNTFKDTFHVFLSIVIFLISSTFNIWIMISIVWFIEIIFHRLREYYVHMQKLTLLIEVNENIDSVLGRLSGRNSLANLPRNLPIIMDRDVSTKIYLQNEENWYVWYENWNRIEKLSSIFFENRANTIYALTSCGIIAACIILYCYFKNMATWNAITVTYLCGLVYFFTIICRFIQCSYDLSNLERKQIKAISNQQTQLKHINIILNKRKYKLKSKIQDCQIWIKWLFDQQKILENKNIGTTASIIALKRGKRISGVAVDDHKDDIHEEQKANNSTWRCLNCKSINDTKLSHCQPCSEKKNKNQLTQELNGLIKQQTKLEEVIEQNMYINTYLDDVIQHIQRRSLSPKIAGVTLNQAFVRISLSFAISCMSFAITYYVKKYL